MLQKQFEKITKWQTATFPKATAISQIEHLKEEVEELEYDLQTKSPDKVLEYADCFILLFGSAFRDGMNYEDIVNAIDEKMKINYSRKWDKAKENGVVNHVR